MRRDSKRAIRLVEATGVVDSRLEAWSHKVDGIAFLAPGDSPDDEALVAALLKVGTEGSDRVRTTLIVAGRHGLACHDYKTALVRGLQLDDPRLAQLTAPLDLDETGNPTDDTEEACAEAERRAHEIERLIPSAAVAMRRKLEASAPAWGETPEELWHSFSTLLVTMMSGGNPYPTQALPAMFGGDLGGLTDAEVKDVLRPGCGSLGAEVEKLLASLGTPFNLERVRRIIDEQPAADLARLAPQFRPMSQIGAALFHIPFDADRDVHAACLVPYFLAFGTDVLTRFTATGTFLSAMPASQTDLAEGGPKADEPKAPAKTCEPKASRHEHENAFGVGPASEHERHERSVTHTH